MLLVHILFGLAFYPVAVTCYVIQNRLTFHILRGFIKYVFLIVYWGFRVGLVIIWLYLGFKLSDFVGLEIYSEEISTASDQLVAIYQFVWIVAVAMLAIKAHWKADQLDSEIDEKLNREGGQ